MLQMLAEKVVELTRADATGISIGGSPSPTLQSDEVSFYQIFRAG